jgi:hypothetical protein
MCDNRNLQKGIVDDNNVHSINKWKEFKWRLKKFTREWKSTENAR